MNCRITSLLVLTLIVGQAGCMRSADGHFLRQSRSKGPLADQVKKVKVTPATCVAVADVQMQLSQEEGRSTMERDALRENARKSLQHALQIDPSFQPAYRALAKLHLSLDENERAIETLQKALSYTPQDAQLWSDIGLIYARQRNFPEAIRHMQQAVRMEPDNRIYLRNLGFLQARAAQFEEGFETLRRIMPEAQARLNIARMMYQLHQDEACVAQLRLALAIDPSLTAAQALLEEFQVSPTIQPVHHQSPGASNSQPQTAPARLRFESIND